MYLGTTFVVIMHGVVVTNKILQPTNKPGGTPLYGLYRYVRPQWVRVWFFSRFGRKWGIDFSHFAAILIINRVSIFAL